MTNKRQVYIQKQTTITVPFHDVDALHIVWHGHYYKYFEIARTVLLCAMDYDYPQMLASSFAWPVIESQCKYRSPLRYGMSVIVQASVVEYIHRLKIEYVVLLEDTGQRLANGYTVQVAVDMKTQTLCLNTPSCFREKIEQAIKQDKKV